MGTAIALGAPEPGGNRICLIPRYVRPEGHFWTIPLDLSHRLSVTLEEREDLRTWITPKQ